MAAGPALLQANNFCSVCWMTLRRICQKRRHRCSWSDGSHFGLTHWGRDNIATISQTIFLAAFSWMKSFVFWLKFHWSLFLKVQSTIFQHWFRWWLVAEQATNHYLNQWWHSSTTHICITRPQWVKDRINYITVVVTSRNKLVFYPNNLKWSLNWCTMRVMVCQITSNLTVCSMDYSG